MRRRLLPLLLPLCLLLGAVAAAPVALAGDPCLHDLSRPAATTGFTTGIAIEECTFGPTVTRVDVGDSVTWTNTSQQPHEIVGANLAWGAHDVLVQPGATKTWAFDTAGVYPYSCMIHPGMTGAVVVGDALAAVGARTATEADAGTGTSATGVTATTPDEPGGALSAAAAVAALGIAALAIAVLLVVGVARRRERLAG